MRTRRLAGLGDAVGVLSVGVGVVESFRGRETLESVEAIAVVISGSVEDGISMSELMEDGGGAILTVATSGVRVGSVVGPEELAHGHLVVRGKGVGDDTVRAGIGEVGLAVDGDIAALSGAALLSEGVEATANGTGGAIARSLEVFGETLAVAGTGGGSLGERGAEVESRLHLAQLFALAVALELVTLLMMNLVEGLLGDLLVNLLQAERLRSKASDTTDLLLRELGVRDGTLSGGEEVSTLTKVVQLTSIELASESLMTLENGPHVSTLVDVLGVFGRDGLLDTLEVDLLVPLMELELLNRSLIQDGTSVEELQVTISVVDDLHMDARVTLTSKGNVQNGSNFAMRGYNMGRHRGSQTSGQSNGRELHDVK